MNMQFKALLASFVLCSTSVFIPVEAAPRRGRTPEPITVWEAPIESTGKQRAFPVSISGDGTYSGACANTGGIVAAVYWQIQSGPNSTAYLDLIQEETLNLVLVKGATAIVTIQPPLNVPVYCRIVKVGFTVIRRKR
jgi:hypothetical protein